MRKKMWDWVFSWMRTHPQRMKKCNLRLLLHLLLDHKPLQPFDWRSLTHKYLLQKNGEKSLIKEGPVTNGSNKGLECQSSPSGLTPKDEEWLRKTYSIPPVINIVILKPYALNSTPTHEGRMAFHEDATYTKPIDAKYI